MQQMVDVVALELCGINTKSCCSQRLALHADVVRKSTRSRNSIIEFSNELSLRSNTAGADEQVEEVPNLNPPTMDDFLQLIGPTSLIVCLNDESTSETSPKSCQHHGQTLQTTLPEII